MSNKVERCILIADDDTTIQKLLKDEFERAGYQVILASDGTKALNLGTAADYEVAFLDINLPGTDGLSVLQAIKSSGRSTYIVMMTAQGSIDEAVSVMKMQADDYITKPFDTLYLTKKVEQILKVRQWPTYQELSSAGTVVELLGEGVAVRKVRAIVNKVKDRDTNVLITGESGTGKGVVAKYIHQQSNRSNQPFVHIDCASIPSNLIESELFGHEKGSFTGAVTSKKGKMELAGRGTIFLDEISLLPLELQAKLLVVLQDRYFTRLGGIKHIPLMARIIAATNEDLEKAVERNLFRRDLYYRLHVVCIECQPLRNRRDDIPAMARFFLKKHIEKTHVDIENVDDDIFSALMRYNYPGNVRELENMLESVVVLSDGKTLTVDDLPKKITDQRYTMRGVSPLSLEGQEYEAILAALEKNDGHRERTAQQLGISRRTLQYKLVKYHIVT